MNTATKTQLQIEHNKLMKHNNNISPVCCCVSSMWNCVFVLQLSFSICGYDQFCVVSFFLSHSCFYFVIVIGTSGPL